jgi:hypothetical protein
MSEKVKIKTDNNERAIQQKQRELDEAIAWERELEDQLAMARLQRATCQNQLEDVQALREDFIVARGKTERDTGKVFEVGYVFTVRGKSTERSERITVESRSEAMVEFWKRPPFSRLAERVEILSVEPVADALLAARGETEG